MPFHLTGRGITTRPMGWEPVFMIDFDFVDHRLVVDSATSDAATTTRAAADPRDTVLDF